MGFFGELLYGSDSRKRAMSRLKSDYLTRYGQLSQDIERSFDPIIGQISQFREQNISRYRTDIGTAMQNYTAAFDRAQRQYETGMGQAISEMRTGRESTIEMLRATVARQEQAATMRNAFTGLGGTTFGQQSVQRIGTQGALQEGMIREQYAQQLSALEAQRASGLSGMSMQYGSGIAQMGAQMATGTSSLFQNYGSQITGAELARQQQAYGARGVGLAGYFGAAQARAALEGGDAARFGQMGMSIIGAGLGSWAAGGFTNPFASGGVAPMNAGVNTGQIGVQGPYGIA
jgi:hypothetical protein